MTYHDIMFCGKGHCHQVLKGPGRSLRHTMFSNVGIGSGSGTGIHFPSTVYVTMGLEM